MPREMSNNYKYQKQKYLLNQPLSVDVQHMMQMQPGQLYPNARERVQNKLKR